MKEVVKKENHLLDKINSMSSDSDRAIAKLLLADTLPKMQEYINLQVRSIRQQLLQEQIGPQNRYEIAVTVCERGKRSVLPQGLFPMVSGDDADIVYKYDETNIYFPVMICETDMVIAQYIKNGFTGGIVTEQGSIPVTFQIVKNEEYLSVVEELRKSFARNGIPWKNLHKAYLNKFYYLTLKIKDFPADIAVEKYYIDDEEIAGNVLANIIPMWNVQLISLQSNDFPVMQEDKIRYRYDFILKQDSEMISAETDETGYSIRYPDKLSYFAMDNEKTEIHFWKLHRAVWEQVEYEYPIFNNGFVWNMSSSLERTGVIHSPFELERRIYAMPVSKGFVYEGCRILQTLQEGKHYLLAEDESNGWGGVPNRSFLEMDFRNKGIPEYLYLDSIQFVIDSLQQELREFQIVYNIDRSPADGRGGYYAS